MNKFLPKKDIIEKAVESETSIFRGLGKEKFYKTPLRFFISFSWALLWFFLGGVILSILIAGLIKAVQQSAEFSVVIMPVVLMGFFSFLFLALSIRLILKLIRIFKLKSKKFRLKVLFPLLILSGLSIGILILTFYSLINANFIF